MIAYLPLRYPCLGFSLNVVDIVTELETTTIISHEHQILPVLLLRLCSTD
jgi:hypothetical protein